MGLCACTAYAADGAERELFEQRFKSEVAPIFAKRCTECHGPEKKKGGVRLDQPATLQSVIGDTEQWLALIEQVSTQQMPPEDKPKLDAKDTETLVKWATAAVDLADNRRPKDPGFVLPRRLNRTEYNNTTRDLLGIDLRLADEFPPDDSGYGFDNIAAVLTMSPLLAEKYLEAAEIAVDVGFGGVNPRAKASGNELRKNRFKLMQGVQFNGTLDFLSEATATFSTECKIGSEYELKASAWQDKALDEPAKAELRMDGNLVLSFDIPNSESNPLKFKHEFKATATKHEFALKFTNDFYDAKKRLDRNLHFSSLRFEPLGGLGADGEFAKRVLIAKPGPDTSDEKAAELVLYRFAMRAYRRTPTADELIKLLKFYHDGFSERKSTIAAAKDASKLSKETPYEAGIKRALTAVLVSPHFLLRTEPRRGAGVSPANLAGGTPAPHSIWELSDYEIATRLSYFFWSSMPDDALFELAEKNQLREPAVRAREIKRMLADQKSKALVKNFGGQWLELRNLDEVSFNGRRFPEWNNDLANAMHREGEMLFEEIVKEDKSVLDFLDPGYTFLNEKLAKHYGIADVKGDEMRRVSTAGSKRGGILTMGSTLAVTSNPTRTSPVKRGKWVLENVLGAPPPPPPPEVPALADKPKDEAETPLRERLEKHRADPTCAVCHIKMDGFGFALENFDAIGRWREKDGKFPVDAGSKIPGEDPINGVDDLKKAMLKHKDQFIRNLADKLLTYALGRGTKPYDRPTLNQIVRRADAEGNKFSSLILAIVESDAFLKRRERRENEQ